MKRILPLLALLCTCFGAAAQDLPVLNRIHVVFGPKIGVNLNKLDGQNWDGGYKTNLLGGAALGIHGQRFGVQVEGLFSQTTYVTGPNFDSIYHQYLNAGKDSLTAGRFRVSYFNIPVMAEVRILSRVWLQVGAQYSGLVSVKDMDEFVKDAESLFTKGSIAIVGGLHIEITKHVNAGARYVMGLSDVNGQYDQVPEAWKQRNIQLHLGYTF